MMRLVLLAALTAAACGEGSPGDGAGPGGKADDPFANSRQVEVVLTDPACDVCTAADKDVLRQKSAITAAVIGAIDDASQSIDAAQFTFSVREIEAALIAAKARGVAVRLAMDSAQQNGDTVATRLAAAGLEVRFVVGKAAGSAVGLQHAKFLIADGETLVTGSNNWSSTGTTINEENTMVIRSETADPLVAGFQCHFEAMWSAKVGEAGACSNSVVAFAPSSAPIAMIKEAVRGAERSVDVLMHHLVFDDLVKVLAQAQERGVRVRVVTNDGDQGEQSGRDWDRLRAAGAELRTKSNNADLFQLMHHKLVIVDDRVLINGSGNWSGSAFFNNYENYVRYANPDVVRPFRELFARLWMWSLSAESRAADLTAAEQHDKETGIFFGNLHAHIAATAGGRLQDDGKSERQDGDGNIETIDAEGDVTSAARFAFEYARDLGGMDFLAVSPHTKDERAEDGLDQANISRASFGELISVSANVTKESAGAFVALPSMEWNTNSAGNHVNVFGSREVAKTVRDRFDHFWGEFMPSRAHAGDAPTVQLNHPRTFQSREETLDGSWDQVFDVNLMEVASNSERDKKFNDYGLDDYEPLASVRARWLSGQELPSRAIVAQTMENLRAAAQPYVRLMEVTIGRGNEFGSEVAANPSLTVDAETQELVRITKVHSDWDVYLLAGFEIAPSAPHDNHMANWGTGHTSRTAITAKTLDEAALLDAIFRREVYASEDQNLAIRFYAADRVPMGSRLRTTTGSVPLRFRVTDPDYAGPIRATLVIGTVGESAVRTIEVGSLVEGAFAAELLELAAGRHFVYLEVTETDVDRMAWSSPIFIDVL